MTTHVNEGAEEMATQQASDQRLAQLLASAQQDQRIAEALTHYHRAAALIPAVTYAKPTTRFSAGANQ